jgi:hypothetical protein
MKLISAFLAAILLMLIQPLQAVEIRTLAAGDISIDIRVFPADGNRLLLGFPFDEGRSIAEEKTARSLAEDGIEVWMPDMLSAYMLPKLRSSIGKIPTEGVLELIRAAMKTGKDVYLIASGPETDLVLRGARYWEAGHNPPLGGAVLMFPRLYQTTPEPGQEPQYVEDVGKTHLPIMVLEGERTPNRWSVEQLKAALAQGGSPVTVKVIPMVRGYFFKREDANRSEEVVTSQLAGLVKVSLFYLERANEAE